MKRKLLHSWRWFGPGDRVSLAEIKQTGAVAVVSALHQLPTGKEWSPGLIRERKKMIENAGLTWSVVESVPIHEDIKLRTGDYKTYIRNYKETIRNLGRENIETLCYNFMPVLDWSRTDLKFRFEDGSESLHFDYSLFAVIDIFILRRKGASGSYPDEVSARAEEFYNRMDQEQKDKLKNTFLLGLPGSEETFTIEEVLQKIERYRDISREQLKSNLREFVKEIAPVAEQSGVRLAIHPDDPPWSLMGLPKAVSTLEDALDIINAVDTPFNGITLCTGSFGASTSNDLPYMAKTLASRINFAHLRNVSRDDHYNFHEDYLFEGDVDIYSVMKSLVKENIKRQKANSGFKGIPVRPDHGAQILGDIGENNYPGYSLYGRMKSLSEIIGLEIGIINSLSNE